VTLAGEEVPVVVAMTCLTCLANLTGQPVVAIPDPLSAAVPPSGLQLLGCRGRDEALFATVRRLRTDLCAADGLCDPRDNR
jgi:Asp-tRNA(Asn)/Glu-tRNA(Gln) amidotransferase A subunit family amidase